MFEIKAKMRFSPTIFVFALGLFGFQSATQARFIPTESLPSVVEFDHRFIRVQKTGHASMTREVLIRVQNEDGRNLASVQRFNYNGRAQKLTILDAYVVQKDGAKIKVPLANIEDKETSEPSQFFDSLRMVSIAFPRVAVGSKVYFKYDLDETEIPIAGFFDFILNMDDDSVDELKVEIKSDLPLFYKKNDPNGYAQVDLSPNLQKIVISNLKPMRLAVDQEKDPFFRQSRRTFVAVSTLSDWNDFAKDLVREYESLVAADLPLQVNSEVSRLAKTQNETEQIEEVLKFVTSEFRYFGDWRRRRGGHLPRPLAEIVESRYGDCKDLSLLTAAMLRRLGYQAEVAWVFRSELPMDNSFYLLPSESVFNHAIVRVQKGDRVRWLDPTNSTVYIGSTLHDISDRLAFVVRPNGAGLEHIPELDPATAINEYEATYKELTKGEVQVSGVWKIKGRTGLWFANRALNSPTNDLKTELVRLVSGGLPIDESKVGDIPVNRIFREMQVPIQYRTRHVFGKTSAGKLAFLPRPDVVDRVLFHDPGREADLYLAAPNTLLTRTLIEKARLIGKRQLSCSFNTEWFQLSRSIRGTTEGVRLEDTVKIKKQIIPIEKIRSREFEKMQEKVRECYVPSGAVFR